MDAVYFTDGDLTDGAFLINAVCGTRPTKVNNLATQSFVGTLNLLEAIKKHAPQAKFY